MATTHPAWSCCAADPPYPRFAAGAAWRPEQLQSMAGERWAVDAEGCAHDASWRYYLTGAPPLLGGEQLCALFNDSSRRLILSGDSLTRQLHASWRARLHVAGVGQCAGGVRLHETWNDFLDAVSYTHLTLPTILLV